jgi:hypothetical protein
VSRFGIGTFDRSAHRCVRRSRAWGAMGLARPVVTALQFMRLDCQRLRIDFLVDVVVNKL